MSSSTEFSCAFIRVSGIVQGVGFRQWTRKLARQRNLQGWVKNLSDNETVEAIIQGQTSSVKRMTELLSQGPPGSRVDEIDVQWTSLQNLPDHFEIRR
jgi:acylphosphatase